MSLSVCVCVWCVSVCLCVCVPTFVCVYLYWTTTIDCTAVTGRAICCCAAATAPPKLAPLSLSSFSSSSCFLHLLCGFGCCLSSVASGRSLCPLPLIPTKQWKVCFVFGQLNENLRAIHYLLCPLLFDPLSHFFILFSSCHRFIIFITPHKFYFLFATIKNTKHAQYYFSYLPANASN